MRKDQERENPTSCWNAAHDDELMFVLLGRDASAPATIRAWCAERIRTGKNVEGDWDITQALQTAFDMEQQQR